MKWTTDMEDRVRSLWLSGESASKIGAEMGFSRNSIISKVTRLGLIRKRETKLKSIDGRKSAVKNRVVKTAVFKSPHAEAGGVSLADLGPKGCRFIVTPHEATEHLFCAQPASGTYCNKHRKICYVKKEDYYNDYST